jgi:hypothetical protein
MLTCGHVIAEESFNRMLKGGCVRVPSRNEDSADIFLSQTALS